MSRICSIPKIDITYIQQPYAKGLGDAIRLGKEFVGDEPFGILLPDDFVLSDRTPALKQLIDVFNETNSSVLGLKQVNPEQLKKYGVIQGATNTDLIQIENIVEKPKQNPPSDLAVIGRYILTPTIFLCIEDLTEGVDGELQLTDAIKFLTGIEPIYGKIVSGDRYDIGNLEEYVELMKIMSKKE